MSALTRLRHQLRALFRSRETDRELEEEIAFHLEEETRALIAGGMSAAEASRCAAIRFGARESIKEEHRDGRWSRWLQDAIADTRFALRSLRRTPSLAATALLTLALGIGANTAIFTAVRATLLRPLPFPGQEQLVALWEQNAERGWYQAEAAPANFLDWKAQVGAFSDVAAYIDFPSQVTLTGNASPQMLTSSLVTGNFFQLLGVRPTIGRTFDTTETWATGTPVAVISEHLWRTTFAADSSLPGRTVMLDGVRVQVVGVVPSGLDYPFEHTDIWQPTAWPRGSVDQVSFRRAHYLGVIARLRPGVSVAAANSQLQTVVGRLERDYPATNVGMGAGITPLRDFLSRQIRLPILLLLGAVVVLLVIACANVGNLLLVRAADREQEIALRLALGAGRGRLARQALTESLVLASLGGALGLILGWWGSRTLLALQPAGMLPTTTFGLDWQVLAYVIGITTASALLFGLAPIAWMRHRRPGEALKEGGRGSRGGGTRRWGRMLAVSQVALALLLTSESGLLLRSLAALQDVRPGFDPAGVLAAELVLPRARYPDAGRVNALYDRLLAGARALPGVEAAAMASRAPLTTVGWSSDFAIAGRGPNDFGIQVVHREITPDYMRVMHVPLIAGRYFTTADNGEAPSVVIINEAIARKYFDGQDPVGQRITFDRVPDSTSQWRTIVGVVGSERQERLDAEPVGEFYAPVGQDMRRGMTLLVRSPQAPERLEPALRRLVTSLDPNLPIVSMQTMLDIRDGSLARERFLFTLLLMFAMVGLTLAAVGVYGIIAQVARRRTREMGIRLALGASRSSVQWLLLRDGAQLTGAGIVLGLGVAVVATRLMRTLLFGVGPGDPATLVVVALVLVVAGGLAAWIPALRAGRVDPVQALREE